MIFKNGHLFEDILNEASKARFINAIPDLTDEEKQTYIDFFDSHPQAASSINWQKKDELTKDTLDAVMDKVKTKSNKEYDAREKFRLGTTRDGAIDMFNKYKGDLEIIYENEKFLFVKVLTYEGAKFCDSFDCGGEGAKWCIGWETTDQHWKSYTGAGITFIMAYNKKHDTSKTDTLKYMLEIGPKEVQAWLQSDHHEDTIKVNDFKDLFGIDVEASGVEPKISIDKRTGYKTFYGLSGQAVKFSIGNEKFDFDNVNCYSTNKFIIPEGVEAIDASAFRKISTKEIILPNSLITLNGFSLSFTGDTLTIPENVEYVNLDVLTVTSKTKNLKKIIFKGNDFRFTPSQDTFLKIYSNEENSCIKEIIFERPHYLYELKDGYIIEKTHFGPQLLKVVYDNAIIPNNINIISNNCFSNASYDTLYLPNSIKKLDSHMLNGAKINTLIIPESVKEISCAAFLGVEIQNIVFKTSNFEFIPYGGQTYYFTNIPNNESCIMNPFIDVKNLKTIKFERLSDKYYLMGNFLLRKDSKGFIHLFSDNLDKSKTEYIPEGVEIIDPNAITHDAILPKSTKILSNYAATIAVRKLILNNGLLYIGKNALGSLSILDIPSTVKKIYPGNYSMTISDVITHSNIELPEDFNNKNFTFTKLIDGDETINIDGLTYTKKSGILISCDTTKVGPVIIPNGITKISQNAFSRCTKITSIIIPDTVIQINNYAFYHCLNLKSISLPNNKNTIYGKWIFYDCKRLETVDFGSMITIPDYLFQKVGLRNITIPNGVTTIGEGAFIYDKALTTITIPKSVTFIGSMAFSRCDSLSTINYLGTMQEWRNLRKNIKNIKGGNKAVLNCTINCFDGSISGAMV